MKILVIPDVHLKPQMFKQATFALMHHGNYPKTKTDRAKIVDYKCLMDIPDDYPDKQYNVGLYEVVKS